MQVLISAAGRYNTFMLAVLALAMSALVIAACDSTIAPETGATIDPGDELVLGKGHQVAVCHVGHKLPEYDPACTEDCGDAGKVDLIFVPQRAVSKHVGNPAHTYRGVVDYYPGEAGATGEGQEDTSDDGVYVDDGCVIPDQETIFAIAYTDVDPNDGDGFKEGTDVLIAKLVDENGDGQPGASDMIKMGQFPTSIASGDFVDVNVKEHNIDRCLILSAGHVACLLVGGSAEFVFFDRGGGPVQEYYQEFSRVTLRTSIMIDRLGGLSSDLITIDQRSPSEPTGAAFSREFDPNDGPFIDVDLNLPVP